MTLIQVNDLNLTLGGRQILSDIGLTVTEGAFHLFIGPNGAGKSSLLKCILGLHRFDSGSIHINGEPLGCLTGRQRARLIAYVPQFLDLQFNLDVASFMALSRFAHDRETPSQRDAIVAKSLAATGTAHLYDAYLDQLSGGERQRILIAAALAQEPRILILDEPNQSLDPDHRVSLVGLLDDLYQKGDLTILLVTHDWNEFMHLDPVIHGLKEGRHLLQCGARDLRNHLGDLFSCAFHHLEIEEQHISIPRFIIPRAKSGKQ